MGGHETMGGAREAPVGDQSNALAESLADNGSCPREHRTPPRTASWSLAADDDHIALFDLVREHSRHGGLLALEHPCRADVATTLVAGQLDHAPVGCHVAAQNRKAAGRLERVGERTYDLLAGSLICLLGVLTDRAPGDRDRIGAQPAYFLQALKHERHAARLVQVGGDVLPTWLQVA